MTKKEIDTKFEIAKILVKHLECDTSKVLSPLYDYLQEQLLIHSVSQQRELLGCNHDKIRVDGKDIGTCVKCDVKMEKAWQPNYG